jgi:hypothetical protein
MEKHLKNIFAESHCVPESRLIQYVNNELNSADKFEVEKHLIDCEMCSDFVEGMSLLTEQKSADAITELKAAVINISNPNPGFAYSTFFRIAASIILLAVVSVVAYMLVRNPGLNEKIVSENKIIQEKTLEKEAVIMAPDQNEMNKDKLGDEAPQEYNTMESQKKKLVADIATGVNVQQEKKDDNFEADRTISTKTISENNSGAAILQDKIVSEENQEQSREYIASVAENQADEDVSTSTIAFDGLGSSKAKTNKADKPSSVSATAAGNSLSAEEETVARNFRKELESDGGNNYSFIDIAESFEKGNYDKTIKLCEKILLSDSSADDVRYFLARAYQQSNKLAKALVNFELLAAKQDFSYKQDAQWFHALALIDAKRPDEAKVILKQIVYAPDHKFYKMALKKMDEFEN